MKKHTWDLEKLRNIFKVIKLTNSRVRILKIYAFLIILHFVSLMEIAMSSGKDHWEYTCSWAIWDGWYFVVWETFIYSLDSEMTVEWARFCRDPSQAQVDLVWCWCEKYFCPAVRARSAPSAVHFFKVKGGKGLSLHYVAQNWSSTFCDGRK